MPSILGGQPAPARYPNGENSTPGAANATSVVSRLMRDYGLTQTRSKSAAAGVMGYESGNFQVMQERGQPPGSGGWGWAQWTGPRRRAFMDWATAHNLDPSSDEANYGFLQHELATDYAGVIPIMRQQTTVEGAADAWERHFEGMTPDGAGIPNFAGHEQRALAYDQIVPQDPLAAVQQTMSPSAPPAAAGAPTAPKSAGSPYGTLDEITPGGFRRRIKSFGASGLASWAARVAIIRLRRR